MLSLYPIIGQLVYATCMLYKIASKMVANQVKQVLPGIIVESHSAFVLGRLITDNIITAFEINHFLKNKTVGKMVISLLKLI